MRYELNINEDKVNDVLDKCGASYDLKGCCDLLNELNDERMMYKITIDKRIVELEEENEQLKKYCTVLKNQIKKMGEIGGFNKHMIKTILESNYDD